MRSHTLSPTCQLPLLVQPSTTRERSVDGLTEWAAQQRTWIERELLRHGGLLFRGFDLSSPNNFERFCKTVDLNLKDYVGGESPRRKVRGKIYTSTDYPSHLPIPLHNELSYASQWPPRVYFFCLQRASQGGETIIADSREILKSIAPDVRARFEDRKIMYVRNLHDGWGLGKSWQETFETDDRKRVEQYCRDEQVEFEWLPSGLTTKQTRPAVIDHPQTGEQVWFNQADLWHASSRGRARQAQMSRVLKEEDFPRHAYYGDGTRIANEDLDMVREVYQRLEVPIVWQPGDAAILDNVLVAHGRRPFSGPRQILVAMAGSTSH